MRIEKWGGAGLKTLQKIAPEEFDKFVVFCRLGESSREEGEGNMAAAKPRVHSFSCNSVNYENMATADRSSSTR